MLIYNTSAGRLPTEIQAGSGFAPMAGHSFVAGDTSAALGPSCGEKAGSDCALIANLLAGVMPCATGAGD